MSSVPSAPSIRQAALFPSTWIVPSVHANRDALASLAGARLFATGMTGTVGRWMLAALAEINLQFAQQGQPIVQVVALTRKSADQFWRTAPLASSEWLTPWQGEADTFPFPPGAFTHVLHAACESSQAADQDIEGLVRAITGGMLRNLSLARQCGAQRLCLLSSAAVYGDRGDAVPYRESDTAAPDSMEGGNAYGMLKRAAETIGARFERDFCSARLFAVAGPGVPLDQHFAIGNWIGDAIQGRTPALSSDGAAVRSWMALPDAAVWILAILAGGRKGQAYNVGSDHAMTLHEAACGIAASAGLGLPQRGAEKAQRRMFWVPSVQKAEMALGLVQAWASNAWIEKWLAWEKERLNPDE